MDVKVTHDQVTEATFDFVSKGGHIKELGPVNGNRVLTGNYRTLKVPAADRQETAMSRVIDELSRRDLY